MGFFSDLKEDLSQAVNELVPDESVVEEAMAEEEAVVEEEVVEEVVEEVEEEAVEDDSDEMDDEALFAAAEAAMGIEYEVQVDTNVYASENRDAMAMEAYSARLDEIAEKAIESAPAFEAEAPVVEEVAAPVEEYVEEVVEEEEDDFVSDEVATITQMMTISGDITSCGSIDVIGAINGNIAIRGKLNVTGSITGNSQAAEIYAQGANIVGDVTSTGAVKVGANTVIRGNIYATSAVIAGAVKGDIDVHGPVILDSTAIVMGNIKSKSVQINNGAAIEGMCSQCYADVSPTSFFKDM